MKLRVQGFSDRVILVGEADKVKSLCDELLELGFRPECLVWDGDEGAYQGIPVRPKTHLAELATDNLRVVPVPPEGMGFHEARREIEAYQGGLGPCVNREIEFLAELLSHGELMDPPAVQRPSGAHTWMGMNLGFVMGGVETWVGETYHELRDAGVRVKVVEPLQQSPYIYVGPGFYGVDEEDVLRTGPYERFSDYTLRTIELLCQDPPRIFIDNGSFRTLAGVNLAKKWLGLPTRVIFVLHGDAGIFYNRLKIFQEAVDQIIVVSEDIRRRVVDMLPERAGDVKVKFRLPVPQESSLNKKLSEDTLHIAYAARLERGNKRSLWLKDVAAGLVERKVRFALHIAGDGDCLEELREFAKAQGIEDRMKLYGRIDHSKMNAFYADKHAFVNFSISEGGPLTLFEAMSHGLVPVVTDAGSAKRMIREGESGFLIDDPQQVVERLCQLAADNDLAARMRAASLGAFKAFQAAQGSFIADFM